MLNETEKVLTSVISKFHKIGIALTNHSQDGRINSAIDEDTVIKKMIELSQLFPEEIHSITECEIRDWKDVSVVNEPVNIKITNGKSNDNVSCKLGLYYTLTGKMPNFSNKITWPKFIDKLHKDLHLDNDKDYYFLIINKKNILDSYWTSLKRLTKLTTNGNNLPFQCNWNKNKPLEVLNSIDNVSANKYLFLKFQESLIKRAEPAKKLLEKVWEI